MAITQLLAALALVVSLPVLAKTPEKVYQVAWCAQEHGEAEVVLSDRTRVDCVTDTHAVELDFGRKWSESIGQPLGYAIETSKRAGIVLILEQPSDYKYWIKLNSIIDHYRLPITTWKIDGS